MESDLNQIMTIERTIPLSWYDWWNYWSNFIGIGIFLFAFIFITYSFYSVKEISSTPSQKPLTVENEAQMEMLVNTLLTQKRLTL